MTPGGDSSIAADMVPMPAWGSYACPARCSFNECQSVSLAALRGHGHHLDITTPRTAKHGSLMGMRAVSIAWSCSDAHKPDKPLNCAIFKGCCGGRCEWQELL